MEKIKYWTPDNILKEEADYNIVFGERSNGKTTGVLRYALEEHIKSGYKTQLGIIRRMEEDFRGNSGRQLYNGIVSLGWISKLTKNKYSAVRYYSKRWYLCNYKDDGTLKNQAEEPFAMAFALSSEEHYKSSSYPNIKIILFDEMITRKFYLPNEFILFQNVLSTIIRLRDDVKIFMLGNTINKYCPYFKEMGIKNIDKMEKGTIDVYKFGDTNLKVAVEYSDFPVENKKSNKYFAFNNPKLEMIKQGGWEIALYPHLPYSYTSSDIIYTYIVSFENALLQCEIILKEDSNSLFTYVHRKTTPIKDDIETLVYQQGFNPKVNYRRFINKPKTELEKKIVRFFIDNNVYYQDNETGEVMRNYLLWCAKESKVN